MEYKLIVAVSGFPSLYDSSSLTYRDLNMRSDAWRQVAQIVGVPESECRRKWKMLRDQHRRERQREKERRESGVGLFNYRPWRYSSVLSFLNPFIDARAAGTNGWALDPQPRRPRGGGPDHSSCSTTTETRSDDDDSYGIATTTTSSSEFGSRKRSSCASLDAMRLKEAKTEAGSECAVAAAAAAAAAEDVAQNLNMKELFEMMVQSVSSLASSIAASHPTALLPALPDRPGLLKAEHEEQEGAELLEHSDVEEARPVSPRPLRAWRCSSDSLLEEQLRGEQRDDVTLFLLSLAPALRRLPPEKQSWLRTKIQQLLHHAEFGPTSFE